MDRKTIHKLLHLIKAKNVVDRSNWVGASCPFARWTHESGKDSSPSFGISIGERSNFNCFACHKSGEITRLASVLRALSGEEIKGLSYFLLTEGRGQIVYKTPADKEDDLRPTYLSEDVFTKLFDEYTVVIRSLTFETAELYRLRIDFAEQRLIIPILDSKKRIVGIKGRALRKTDGLRHKFYSDLFTYDPKTFGIWFGMHLPLVKNKAIVLTEGEIDTMKLKQHGVHNVWGCMGTGVSRKQKDILKHQGRPLIFFFDNDKAGHDLKHELVLLLKGLVPLYHVTDYAGGDDADKIADMGSLPKALASIEKII